MDKLEEHIQRLEAEHEIQNMMGRYEYLRTAHLYEETVKLFSKRPDTQIEIAYFGVYEGAKGIRRVLVDHNNDEIKDRTGHMHMATLTTPVIEVAADGKTAKGLWISPGHETHEFEGKLKAYWSWCKFAMDFIKEDGKWKIWHMHVVGIFMTPYEKSWVDSYLPLPPIPEELKADRPTTYHWSYSPEGKTENIPAPPEPYKTWNSSMSYIQEK